MKLQAFWISSCSIQTANPWHWHGSSQSLRFKHNTWQEPLDFWLKRQKVTHLRIVGYHFETSSLTSSHLALLSVANLSFSTLTVLGWMWEFAPSAMVPLWQTLGNNCEEQISWSIIQSNPSIQRFAPLRQVRRELPLPQSVAELRNVLEALGREGRGGEVTGNH